MGIALDPLAELHAAGEVDHRRFGVFDQQFADRLGGAVNGQSHQVGVKPGGLKYLSEYAYRNCHGQHRGRVWLDDHGIACG